MPLFAARCRLLALHTQAGTCCRCAQAGSVSDGLCDLLSGPRSGPCRRCVECQCLSLPPHTTPIHSPLYRHPCPLRQGDERGLLCGQRLAKYADVHRCSYAWGSGACGRAVPVQGTTVSVP
eukprot:2580396-Prymnesium_polylepis.1